MLGRGLQLLLSFCGGFFCHITYFTYPILAWQSGGTLTTSSSFSRRKPTTIAAKTVVILSSSTTTALAAQEEDHLVEMMTGLGYNNNIIAAAGITTIALISSVLSWRRLENVQNELDALREEKRLIGIGNQKEKEIKQQRNQKKQQKKQQEQQEQDQQDLVVKPIGVIRSIYRLCVGTPRQGLLCQDARGRIELAKLGDSSSAAAVSGLEEFSYIWVLFHFHLNNKSGGGKKVKSKISPPALGGKKVGIFCTRTPHRYNPIGITLCKLDRVQINGPHDVTLHVSGLDLVDGTPVIDIKPYVSVYDSVNSPSLPPPRVPEWVEGGLATKRDVVITENAKNELEEILRQDPKALEFYGPHCGDSTNDNESDESNTANTTTTDTMLRVIEQVLAIDVRSSFQTRKARTGRSQADRAERVRNKFEIETTSTQTDDSAAAKQEVETNDVPPVQEEIQEKRMCTQQLDNLLINYNVKEVATKREQSNNSGAEDIIVVESIELLPSSISKKKRELR
jgi:tRNA-Thr(GGU) m(6)t(6)A37 methyltransferase TsaA